MKRLLTSRVLGVVTLTSALALTGCGEEPADLADNPGGGGNGQGFTEQLTAPEPEGDQLSHQEMSDALAGALGEGASMRDTDDLLPGLRDVETELQRLAVDPQDCKQYVVESATPIPDGSLVVHAEAAAEGPAENEGGEGESAGDETDDEGEAPEGAPEAAEASGLQATVYTYADPVAAEAHFSQESTGVSSCGRYTITRTGAEGEEVETETSLEVIEVASGAEEAVGLNRAISVEGERQQSVAVLLRHGSQMVSMTTPVPGDLDEDETEEAIEELEAQAAELLSELTGETIVAPEDEDDEDDDGNSEGANDDEASENDEGGAEDVEDADESSDGGAEE